ncbi:MAG: TerC/Alx family metal homeostasis membrane protein, partial [Verrucomicrobiota bacterium]|nr:TerC/Alx family metal homeostasis membrane protein [Verrucomicrobiota bacterium]
VDNIFVFALIFAYFKVASHYQHRVLFWGIIGAAVMRSIFILVGVSALHRFHWIIYFFGAFLVYTGVKMAVPKRPEEEIDPEKNAPVRLLRRLLPVTADFEGANFFKRKDGLLFATPLFLVLFVVETTDLVFAFDSLPAVLAITDSGFIALTSNIFAILGLRSLYFAVSGVMKLFRFLKTGLAVVLIFIGGKMLIEPWWKIPTGLSLAVIGTVILTSILMSTLIKSPSERP